jgi:hypothetical protein
LPNFWGGGRVAFAIYFAFVSFSFSFSFRLYFLCFVLNLDVDYCYGWTRRDVPGRRLCGLDKLPILLRLLYSHNSPQIPSSLYLRSPVSCNTMSVGWMDDA